MFELLIAFKYLIPRKKQLSVALISCMSVLVISLVVWLVLVFLSVTEGIERGWLQKLTTLNAPLRITPTPFYYSSYYYSIDPFCAASGYREKNIAHKLDAPVSDPYEMGEDGELPAYFPRADRGEDGTLKDPVKQLVSVLEGMGSRYKGFTFQEFELGGALLRLQLLRPEGMGNRQNYLTQASYLATLPDKSPRFASLLIPPSEKDFSHLAYLSQHTMENVRQDAPAPLQKGDKGKDLLPVLQKEGVLPLLGDEETGVLLAKSYKESGVLIGDRGYLAYSSTTTGSLQEHRLPIFVAGFYDPGILSVGNKCILVPPFVTETVNASSSSFNLDRTQSNGILVWFDTIDQANQVKRELLERLDAAGLSAYWKVATFKEYDFARDLMQQFQSDKYLFTLSQWDHPARRLLQYHLALGAARQ